MAQPTRAGTTLGIGFLLLSLAGFIAGPSSSVAGDDLAPPVVRIVAGERTTLSGTRFFSVSCEASNPNKAPVMFVGYRPDSFDPPIEEGNISPIHVIQFQRDGKWTDYPQGWCGTGMDKIELPAGKTSKFGFAVPADLAGKVVRVGIRWGKSVKAKPESFKVAWSKPFELMRIDDTKDKAGSKP